MGYFRKGQISYNPRNILFRRENKYHFKKKLEKINPINRKLYIAQIQKKSLDKLFLKSKVGKSLHPSLQFIRVTDNVARDDNNQHLLVQRLGIMTYYRHWAGPKSP